MPNNHYVLGGYTFDNVDDYWNAQHDMKVIEIIRNNLDVSDPEVAVRLYNMIRDGRIAFATPIGFDFTSHVSDVLADKSINLMDNQRTIDNAEKKVKKQRWIGIVVASIAVIASILFGSSQLGEIMNTRRLESMAKTTRAAKVDTTERMEIMAANAELLTKAGVARKKAIIAAEDEGKAIMARQELEASRVKEEDLIVLPEYVSLLEQNPDLKGWLTIPDTNVDYPVLQREGDTQNEYYLQRAFDGSDDSNGSLFIDYRSDTVNPTENTIIYGHNMNTGKMFGDLKNYLDESYYYDHRNVKFDTLYEERKYEIVAVCLSKVQDNAATDFRYYNFIDAANELEWNAFVQNVNDLSVFSTSVDLEYGDEVLTLSTCNNYTEDGRLFLVAKRL